MYLRHACDQSVPLDADGRVTRYEGFTKELSHARCIRHKPSNFILFYSIIDKKIIETAGIRGESSDDPQGSPRWARH